MSRNKKAIVFICLSVLMIAYIGWTFYISEPKYIDGISSKKIETFDWIAMYEKEWSWDEETNVVMGIVIQVDGDRALVKTDGQYSFSEGRMRDLQISTSKYRIVGRGTIYHKVNQYVGFNIMLISQVFIGILLLIILFTQVSILKDFLS
jgi:hypothetical protein